METIHRYDVMVMVRVDGDIPDHRTILTYANSVDAAAREVFVRLTDPLFNSEPVPAENLFVTQVMSDVTYEVFDLNLVTSVPVSL